MPKIYILFSVYMSCVSLINDNIDVKQGYLLT